MKTIQLLLSVIAVIGAVGLTTAAALAGGPPLQATRGYPALTVGGC